MKKLTLLAVMVGAAGCGKIVGMAQPDGAKVFDDAHAPADAEPIDGNLTGNVRVVTQSHVPGQGALAAVTPGIQVFSLRPNDTMVDLQTTDGTGGASLAIYPGGSVTAVYPHVFDNNGTAAQQGADVVTFVGVKDADALTFGTRFLPYQGGSAANTVGALTIAVNGAGGTATTGYVEVYTPCGYEEVQFPTATATVSIPIYGWCNVSPFEIGGYTFSDTPTFGSSSYLYNSTTLNASNNGSVALSFPAAHTFTESTTGLPAEVTSINMNIEATLNPEILSSEGNFDYDANYGQSGAPSAGAYTAPAKTVYPIGDHFLASMQMSRAGSFSATTLYDQLPASSLAWAVTSPPVTPWLNGSQFFSTENRVDWSVEPTAGASAISAVLVQLTWSHPTTISGTVVSLPYTWNIILPPDATSFTLPKLPSQFAANAPQAETDSISARVRLIDFPSVASYDALRAIPERNIVCPDCAVRTGEMTRAIVTN